MKKNFLTSSDSLPKSLAILFFDFSVLEEECGPLVHPDPLDDIPGAVDHLLGRHATHISHVLLQICYCCCLSCNQSR